MPPSAVATGIITVPSGARQLPDGSRAYQMARLTGSSALSTTNQVEFRSAACSETMSTPTPVNIRYSRRSVLSMLYAAYLPCGAPA